MGEDLYVCKCREPYTNYSMGQCNNCFETHCLDCHDRYQSKYNDDTEEHDEDYLKMCPRCAPKKPKKIKA